MKIAFVHFSDLFFGSGSAVLYSRILAEVSKEHDIFHIIGLHRSASALLVQESYATQLPHIRPIFLPLNNALRIYYRLRDKEPFRRLAALPGMSYRGALQRIFEREKPDFIWWSADYLPESFSALWELRSCLPKETFLHLSLMDPPELWPQRRKCLALYKRCLTLAGSLDCIGDHFRERLRHETKKPVFIINDFVDGSADTPIGTQQKGEGLCAGISGHIYGPVELQEFLLALGLAAKHAELLWFGKPANYGVLNQLHVPSNVQVHCPGTLSRREVINALRPCDFAYLSMPTALPEFARYSVPTKLVTYVEASLPVAFHAPADSEVHGLNQSYHFGVNLALSPSPTDSLRHLIAEPSTYISGLGRLGRERYSKRRVLATVRDLLAHAI